jgi:formate dehydrogenase subunit delta
VGTSQLVIMANEIAAFFVSENEADASKNVAIHLRRYWDPRMRKQIIELLNSGGDGLVPAARAAVELLAADQPRVSS